VCSPPALHQVRGNHGPFFAAPASYSYPQQGSGVRNSRTAKAASFWLHSRKLSGFSILDKSQGKAANKQNIKNTTKPSSQLLVLICLDYPFYPTASGERSPQTKRRYSKVPASPPASLYPSPHRQLSHGLDIFENQHPPRRQPQGSCPRPSCSQVK